MPSNVPRTDTWKKEIQLSKREDELIHARRSELPDAKINKAAENVRLAQLSLLKAKAYWEKERMIRGNPNPARNDRIAKEMEK